MTLLAWHQPQLVYQLPCQFNVQTDQAFIIELVIIIVIIIICLIIWRVPLGVQHWKMGRCLERLQELPKSHHDKTRQRRVIKVIPVTFTTPCQHNGNAMKSNERALKTSLSTQWWMVKKCCNVEGQIILAHIFSQTNRPNNNEIRSQLLFVIVKHPCQHLLAEWKLKRIIPFRFSLNLSFQQLNL